MRTLNNLDKLQNQFISLQGNDWIERQRVAGQHLADIMLILKQLVQDKTKLSLLELDKLVETEIKHRGCTATFKNFKGFPASTCISVNKQLVHGIPSNYVLQDGDLISLDFGVTYEGAIADSAVTVIYGESQNKEHQRLIDTTRDCLYNAIKAIKIGKNIGVIGNAIYRTAKSAGFGVITRFGGHGIGWNKPHADIFIANRSLPEEGIRIQPGLTIAIEPLLVPGSCSINPKLGDDGWTVYTEEIGCHVEHSLYVHPDRVEIISWRKDEAEQIAREIPFD